ncbi:MAG: bacteriohopanetetrol glucosamine biosynthesis glycosyltransferase HpnI [Planctomycetes bacterium]|nr:bacteriohopanetetrol glucosamine biosynthesis glycosyltransferase HpnI [Planctomycetota bacterium]
MLTALMVLMVVLSNSAGDVLLTRGMKQTGDVSAVKRRRIPATIGRIAGNPNCLLGVACLALSFFSFLTVLSWANLSFVVPATAIVYAVTVLGARFVLKEQIDPMRWAGTFLVCLGVALVCLPDDPRFSHALLLKPVRMILGALTAASACYYLVSIVAAEKFFGRRPDLYPMVNGGPAPVSAARRGVSILIPLCGADSRAYDNYASVCRQDYPEFEIVFGVPDPEDSAVAVVARLQADFPKIPIRLVISAEEIGPNPKVNNLNNMLPQAGHEILLMVDSDIRVEPGFLRAISDELPPEGGLVTCLYRAGEAPGTPSKLEAVGISSEFAPGVLVAQMAGGRSFAFGAAIAVTKKTLETAGGFKAIAPYLADDYMLGHLVQKAGLPVRLSGCIVETILSRLTLGGFIRHQIKWARGIRACAPWGHAGSVIIYGTALSFLYFIASGFSGIGLSIFAGVGALRLGAAWIIGVRRLGDKIVRHNLLLVPLRDFLGLFIWSAALVGRRVEWRGRVFQLEKGGRMKPYKEKRKTGGKDGSARGAQQGVTLSSLNNGQAAPD